MKQSKFKPSHWWLLAAALVFGAALFFYLRLRVY